MIIQFSQIILKKMYYWAKKALFGPKENERMRFKQYLKCHSSLKTSSQPMSHLAIVVVKGLESYDIDQWIQIHYLTFCIEDLKPQDPSKDTIFSVTIVYKWIII